MWQAVDDHAYYSVVTASAERAVPGCPAAVRDVMSSTLASAASKDEITSNLDLCELPLYLQEGSLHLLVDEINMIVQDELRGGMPEAIYLFLYHSVSSFTFESPSEFDLVRRIDVQRRFLDVVMGW